MTVILGWVYDLSILIGFTLSPIIHDNMHMLFSIRNDRRQKGDVRRIQ
jgi:hypothetical protein